MMGLVLCGGESRRMGRDKGLLLWAEKTWAGLALEKTTPFCQGAFLSLNAQQTDAYLKHFSESAFIIDSNLIPARGPLLGLLSFHAQYPQEDVLVLACDMVFMEEKTLSNIFKNYSTSTEADAFLYSKDNQPEPLCGIYTAAGLKKIFELVQSRRIETFSLRRILKNLNICYFSLSDDLRQSFSNLNSPCSINEIQA